MPAVTKSSSSNKRKVVRGAALLHKRLREHRQRRQQRVKGLLQQLMGVLEQDATATATVQPTTTGTIKDGSVPPTVSANSARLSLQRHERQLQRRQEELAQRISAKANEADTATPAQDLRVVNLLRQPLEKIPLEYYELDAWLTNMFCPTGKGGGIDATCGKSGVKRDVSLAPSKSSPSKAKVGYLPGANIQNIKNKATNLFGYATEEENMKALVESIGAPDDAKLLLRNKHDGISVRVDHPKINLCMRLVGRDRDGKLFVENEILTLRHGQGKSGLGADIFSRQVEWASSHGVEYIKTHAAGEPGGEMNGYYTWPRFGYDQSISDLRYNVKPTEIDALVKRWPEAKTVQDIFATAEGRQWWKDNGHELENARFDLTPGSRSMQVMGAYLKERNIRQQAANMFCPTGAGGGIDPSCGKGGVKKETVSHGRAVKQDVKLTSEKSKPSNASIKVADDVDEAEAGSMAEKLFGYGDKADNYQAIVDSLGMPDDAELVITEVGPHDSPYADEPDLNAEGLVVQVEHDDILECQRFIGRDNETGKLFIKNVILEIHQDVRGSGMGAEIFSKQVEWAASHGVDHISTHAAGGPGEAWNGYYTWPRFGYDQSIGDIEHVATSDRITMKYPRAKSVLDIMATPEGRQWWKENGGELRNAKFDLTPDSRSMQVMAAYLKERNIRQTQNKTSSSGVMTPTSTTNRKPHWRPLGENLIGNVVELLDNMFCPTGKGGGVDPTCSPRGPHTDVSEAGGGSSKSDKERVRAARKIYDRDAPARVAEMEEVWIGGIADFGQKWAGDYVTDLPEYEAYKEQLHSDVRDSLGESFPMYRAMARGELEDWQNGSSSGPVGFSLDKGVADAWKNVAGHESQDLVVVRAVVHPENVVMRGKREEAELVLRSFDLLDQDVQVVNAFCPTGKGGGIDPSCGKGGTPKQTAPKPLTDAEISTIFDQDALANPPDVVETTTVLGDDDLVDGYAPSHLYYQSSAFIDSLPRSQVLALNSYTGDNYEKLNRQMRECPPEFDCLDGDSQDLLEDIEAVLDKAPPFKKPVQVYRAIRVDKGTAEDLVAEAQQLLASGNEMTMPSLTSTSLNEKWAEKGSDSITPTRRGVLFKIKAKSGVYLESITANQQEYEVLQSSKTRYKVIGARMEPNKAVIELEEVAPVTNAFCPTGKGGGVDPTCGKDGEKKEPVSRDKALKLMEEHSASVISQLSSDEYGYVTKYTDNLWSGLNTAMRKCTPNFDCLSPYHKEALTHIESALDKAGMLPAPVEVQRSIDLPDNPEAKEEMVKLAESMIGSDKVYRMPSITSTSTQNYLATHFPVKNQIMFRIQARSGLYVESITRNKGEEELIQSPKAQYKVTGVDKHASGGAIIDLEEI